jgi:CubicO group peptidase (beta-lactamase class C family)
MVVTAVAACQPASTRLQQVDSLLGNLYANNAPGVSVAILQKGQPDFYKSYGLANIATGQPITRSSNFNIASLTKQFTAIGILQLKYAGKLTLDDKLSHWFPAMVKHIADNVTIKQLLTHTSGIVDHYAYTNTNGMRHAHNADVFEAIKNIDSTYFAPGTSFRYSNTAFCLLALIIEKASGQVYADYMQQHIFKPSGMLHTSIWAEDANTPNKVTGYDIDSATKKFIPSGAEEHIFFSTEGDGGIYTSIDDYLKWFAALQGGKIFNNAMVNEARSLHFTIDATTRTGYGYGWFVGAGTTPAKVYHSGSNGGYRTYSFTIPAQNFILLIFSNRSDIDLENVAKQISILLLGTKGKFTGIEALTS